MSRGGSGRCTKIQATLGPATSSLETIRRMAEAGMDGCRINLSHGTHEEARRLIRMVRRVSEEIGRPMAVGADLRVPKLRIGEMAGDSAILQQGSAFRLTYGDSPGDARGASVDYPHLTEDVRPGSPVLLADGGVILRVEQVSGDGILCRVEKGGALASRKGVNFPGIPLRLPALTPKDLDDMAFAVEAGVDFLYLSYARGQSHLGAVRAELARLGADLPVVAKVERQEGVDALEEIVDAADGVCVARGDLGIEVPVETVPAIQLAAIRMCRAAGKLYMVGGQVLSSMTSSPIPLRAEVGDLAAAVRDGVDAIILSDETAAGSYPVETVRAAARILGSAERIEAPGAHLQADSPREGAPLPAAVVSGLNARMAELLSASRRFHPILAATDRAATANWLSAWWGVTPLLCGHHLDPEEALRQWSDAADVPFERPLSFLRFSE